MYHNFAPWLTSAQGLRRHACACRSDNMPSSTSSKRCCRGFTNRQHVASVEDILLTWATGSVPARVYNPRPATNASLPGLVFLHGGGWCMCSIETHDALCRDLAHQANIVVISVGYRLAPEHKFPAGLEDCYEALQWVSSNAESLKINPQRLAIGGDFELACHVTLSVYLELLAMWPEARQSHCKGNVYCLHVLQLAQACASADCPARQQKSGIGLPAGDSAGGNLSLATLILAQQRGKVPVAFQLLIYPSAAVMKTESRQQFSQGYGLDSSLKDWFLRSYTNDPKADAQNPLISPLFAKDLSYLPPTHVITAECDPLRDEGRLLADRLSQDGVSCTYKCYDGMIHGFCSYQYMMPLDAGAAAVQECASKLCQSLHAQ